MQIVFPRFDLEDKVHLEGGVLIEGEIDGKRCMLENILGRVRELSVC